MSLKEFSDDQLKAELDRRQKKLTRPALLEQFNFTELKKLCEQEIEMIENDQPDDDMTHYIYQAAMEVFYGKYVWNFINGKSQ